MKVKLIVDGGAMKPGPAVAQQLGPMGINLGKVIEDVNKETSSFNGVKVPVEINVDPKTKTYTIMVFSPPAAEMIKKEMGLESGSGASGKTYVGNVAFETILKIAKSKQSGLLAKDLKKAVRMIIGSCTSMGVLIDNKNPKEIGLEVEAGNYDDIIENETTEVSAEKKERLSVFWKDLAERQEKSKKAMEEAKAAEEAAKAAAAAAAPAPTTVGVAAAPAGDKKAAPAKEEKKVEKKK